VSEPTGAARHFVARPILDRPTRITYIQLATFAWFMYGFGASQALLRDDQGVSKTLSSLHSTFLAIGGIIGAIIAARLVARFHRGPVMRVSALGTALGIAIYTIPAGVGITWTGIFIASFFGTILLVCLNAFLFDHQGLAGPASLTQANALASLSGMISPVVIGLAAVTVLGWRAGFWVAIAALVAIEIWRGRNLSVFNHDDHSVSARDQPKLPRTFWWSPILIALFMGTEFSLLLWSPDLLREQTGFGAAAAAASVGTITGGMLVGRLLGARLAQVYQPNTLLVWSVFLALAAFVFIWMSTQPFVVLSALFVMGAGLGLHWPLGVARVVIAADGQTDRASAIASIFGSAAIGIAPFLLGALADGTNVRTAFLLIPVFLLLALMILIFRPVRTVIGVATLP
jgi:fucose permease